MLSSFYIIIFKINYIMASMFLLYLYIYCNMFFPLILHISISSFNKTKINLILDNSLFLNNKKKYIFVITLEKKKCVLKTIYYYDLIEIRRYVRVIQEHK